VVVLILGAKGRSDDLVVAEKLWTVEILSYIAATLIERFNFLGLIETLLLELISILF
jgi:hypothetical protein